MEPAKVILLGGARARDEKAALPEVREGEVADDLPVLLEHRGEDDAALPRHPGRQHPVEPLGRAGTGDEVLGEPRGLAEADPLAHRPALRPDMLEVDRTVPGEHVLEARRGVPERHLEPPRSSELGARLAHPVVDRGRAERAGGGKLLVRIADGEPARVVLLHLVEGVRHGRPVAEAGHVHREHVGPRVAVHHPVRDREPDPASLGEAGHHPARDPEPVESPDRTDERVAVRRERERPVHDLLDPCVLERREMLEADLERGRDPVDVLGEELVAEVPRCLVDRPRHARLLVRPHEHAAAFLPEIELAVEVDDVDHFLAGGLVDRRDLRHVLGDEVHVLHREHRQLEPDHAPHLARPEAGRVDDVLGVDVSLVRDHPPQALTGADESLHLGVAIDLGAELAGGAGVRVGDPRRIDMAVDEGLHAPHEALGIEERHELVRFLGTDDLRLDAKIAPLRGEPLDPTRSAPSSPRA